MREFISANLLSFVLMLAMSGRAEAVVYTATILDPNPSGSLWSYAMGASPTNQAGWAHSGSFSVLHALVWSGTAASFVDLHPAGFSSSFATAVSGATQVGEGTTSTSQTHALLWSGTAASVVDLHPSGYGGSTATGVSGTSQVGYADGHAMLWSGTAASAVDLHPTGFLSSTATGVSGASQAGWGQGTATGGSPHALLWNGTAASVTDLNPAGYQLSTALGAAGPYQAGWGVNLSGGGPYAVAWTGTAASAVDLHPFLTGLGPSFILSEALDVAANGDVVGWAYDSHKRFAILWRPVPEPAPTLLAALAAAVPWVRRGKHTCRTCYPHTSLAT